MSESNQLPSFDDIIQAERRKKRNEALAQSMLGGGRRTPASGSGSFSRGQAPAGPGASLASRVGVVKRSSSATPKPNVDGKWNHDLHHVHNLRAPRSTSLTRSTSASTIERGNRLYDTLKRDTNGSPASSQVNLRTKSSSALSGPSMSIRGMASAAGPWVVIASNFAPGTTAADIEAAMAPVGGTISSCHLVSARPTVMAEIVFADRDGAENVIATFNNQKADGRLLYVYMKPGGPNPRLASEPAGAAPQAHAPRPRANDRDRDMMDVDDGERGDGERLRGAEPAYTDGRYGFREPGGGGGAGRVDGRGGGRADRHTPPGGGLYSDGMYRPGRGPRRR